MPASCPILTPTRRRLAELHHDALEDMSRAVRTAVDDAHRRTTAGMAALQGDDALPPPSRDFFLATLLQQVFCELCHAVPGTLSGGDPRIAAPVTRNLQDIAGTWESPPPAA